MQKSIIATVITASFAFYATSALADQFTDAFSQHFLNNQTTQNDWDNLSYHQQQEIANTRPGIAGYYGGVNKRKDIVIPSVTGQSYRNEIKEAQAFVPPMATPPEQQTVAPPMLNQLTPKIPAPTKQQTPQLTPVARAQLTPQIPTAPQQLTPQLTPVAHAQLTPQIPTAPPQQTPQLTPVTRAQLTPQIPTAPQQLPPQLTPVARAQLTPQIPTAPQQQTPQQASVAQEQTTGPASQATVSSPVVAENAPSEAQQTAKRAEATSLFAQSRADQALANAQANRQALNDESAHVAANSQRIADQNAHLSALEQSTNSKFAGLNKEVDKNRERASAGIAGVAAMANIPQVIQGQNFSIGAGLGSADSESAIAVGLSSRVSEHVVVKSSVSDDSQHNFVFGSGISYGW